MPRSRRRHHSRSRSRSRSHSHDRDRDVKRRKIDNLDSPTQKRSVSVEPESEENLQERTEENQEIENELIETEETTEDNKEISNEKSDYIEKISTVVKMNEEDLNQSVNKQLEEKLLITPKKVMSPKQLQKKLESEKRRQQKQQEKDERERRKQQEKLEKLKQKQEKDEQKEKERQLKDEQKRKEREEKEQRRKEKEKEKEEEKLKKLQELEEKNKEKLKQEEQKQKAAAAFVNFFKKPEMPLMEEKKIDNTSIFMPFEVKSDMRLPPIRRTQLTNEDKENLINLLEKSNEEYSYLKDLKNGKIVGKCGETWPFEDTTCDVILVEDDCDVGETICEDKSKKLKAKFLKFHDNRRPPYFGTFRKKSAKINGRRPFKEDCKLFDYEQDSDDDWEEEEQGESLKGSDDEEKDIDENDNDDYEVDNKFFVPHGHLSDDEIDNKMEEKLSPETLKQKLKLLKDEFDEDMKHKTYKLKPRSIGCIWYKKNGENVDETIHKHLKPLSMLTNGQIIIGKRNETILVNRKNVQNKELSLDLIRIFLKIIHGNLNRKKLIVEEFLNYLLNNQLNCNLSKAQLIKYLKDFAEWKKCAEEGRLFNKFCWNVKGDVQQKYNVHLSFSK